MRALDIRYIAPSCVCMCVYIHIDIYYYDIYMCVHKNTYILIYTYIYTNLNILRIYILDI